MTRLSHLHAYALLVAVLAVLATTTYWLRLGESHDRLRAAAAAQTQQRASQLADAVANQVEALIVAADFAVRELRDDYAELDTRSFEVSVRTVLESFPPQSVMQIGVIGADGFLAYSNLGIKGRPFLGDREHFKAHLNTEGDRLFISKPVLGRVSNSWSIQFSRPVRRKGQFAGVMVMSLSPGYISDQLAALELRPGDVVNLFSRDGAYLARSRDAAGAMGKSIPPDRPFLAPNAPARGIVHLTAAFDRVERTYAWQRLGRFPLIVNVGLDEKPILAPIEAEIGDAVRRNGVGAGLVLLLAAAITILLLRIARQQGKMAESEALHRVVFATMAEGVGVIDRDGRIVSWNEEALRILDVDAEGLVQRRAIFIGADGAALAANDFPSMRAARGDFVNREVMELRRRDGSRAWINISSRPLETSDPAQTQVAVVSFSDITRLVEAEGSLRLAQSVFEAAGEGIVVTDTELKIVAVNPAFTAITGYAGSELIGDKPPFFKTQQHDPAFYRTMLQRLDLDGRWEGEASSRRKDGEVIVEWLKVTLVRDEQGRPHRYVALVSDITERKLQEESIWHQANFDALTGLPNRKLLEDRIDRAVAQASRKRSQVAVLFIDLDRFKPVNDQYGHAVGDDLLRQVARRLENTLRDEDTIARLGGDEFVAVLPDLLVSEAPARAAEKILAVLSDPFRVDGHIAEISCSIGIALFPRDAEHGAALIDKADAAMYRAKEAGRSTWQLA